MFIVESYVVAVIFCVITMTCWGSFANTQKLAAKSWRYELYYWDYVIGMLLFSLILAFTMGSIGEKGRPFIQDFLQADEAALVSVMIGGAVFNLGNILLSAATSIAGMAVAFPLGVGLSLVLGTIINYIGAPKGNPLLLFLGVGLIVVAIIFNAVASKMNQGKEKRVGSTKGLLIAVAAGVALSFFYRFVAAAMDLDNFASPAAGKVTPYTAIVFFSVGVFISNIIFNTILMKRPFVGEAVTYKQYYKGAIGTHAVGMLGGAIWCLGTAFSYIASGMAGAAISYALGQGSPLAATIWGVFVWKEFKGAKSKVYCLLALMFAIFVAGLGMIVISGN